jgi:flagellar biosynthesis chaperone FliJ
MEVASSLHEAIRQLKERRRALEQKIEIDKIEKSRVAAQAKELQKRVDILGRSLEQSTSEMTQLVKTIDEAGRGYEKIVESGETLMAILRQHVTKAHTIETKPHLHPDERPVKS